MDGRNGRPFPVDPAGGVFGERRGAPPLQLDRVPDHVRQEGVPLDLQYRRRASGGDGNTAEVKKIRPSQAGADVPVHGDPDVAGAKDVGLPGVVHNGPGAQELGPHLLAELPQKGREARPETVRTALRQGPGLRLRQGGALLPAQPADLALLFQEDQDGVPVVAAEAEFLPAAHPVQLFPEGPVRGVVEVQAPDEVPAVPPVTVGVHDGPEPPAEGQEVGSVDLVLPLVTFAHGFQPHPFRGHRIARDAEGTLKKSCPKCKRTVNSRAFSFLSANGSIIIGKT